MLIKKYTQHALQRLQQRGKSREGAKLIMRYGKKQNHHEKILFHRSDAEKQIVRRRRWIERLEKHKGSRRIIRALRRRVQILERAMGCVVVQKDGQVITIYNQTRRNYRR